MLTNLNTTAKTKTNMQPASKYNLFNMFFSVTAKAYCCCDFTIIFVGGFKEMMIGWDKKRKRSHLQDAFQARYGKDHFTILFDLDSELEVLLNANGLSIVELSTSEDKVTSNQTFGSDRVAFLKVLRTYFIDQ